MRRALAPVLAAALVALVAPASPDAANAPAAASVTGLRVAGNDGRWTAATNLELRWTLRPEGDQVTGVVFGLLGGPYMDEPQMVETPAESGEMSRRLEIPHAPGQGRPAPGTYLVAAWALSGSAEGPIALTSVRIDNVQPGPAVPRLDAPWHRADAAPVLRISHPTGELPPSGIRGYAVSLRRGSGVPPCAGVDACSEQETDLAAGIDDDELAFGPLPEGIHVASVVAVSNTGMRSAITETALVRVDATRPELTLEGTGGGWSNRPVRVLAKASDPLSGMAAAGASGPRTTIAVDGAGATAVRGDEAAAVVSGSGVHTIAATARDAAGNERGGVDPASVPLTGLVRIDEAPPALAFTRAADPADPELIEAVVHDPLSGPATGAIGVRPFGSDQAFAPLPTSSEDGRLSARWDSDSFPRGSYEFRVTGYDAAGNAASSTERIDGTQLVLANPVKAESAVRFGFGGRKLIWQRCVRSGESRRCRREVVESFGRRPAARVVPYARGVQVGGQVVSATGAPLAGVEVELIENFDAGASATARVTRVRTGPDGTFFARLAPGPSRLVEARFGGSSLLTRSSSRSLRLGVQAAVRFRASTTRAAVGGRPVVFRGRVLHSEATIPSYGRPVQLQFRLPGMPWSEFRTVQTDRAGRFEYPYSFSDDDSRGVRFMFRAYVPPQPGWPYEPAASRPLAVTGY